MKYIPLSALYPPDRGLTPLLHRRPSIITTVRKKGILSTSSWLPAHVLDSFVALPSAKRFPAKTDPD